MNRFKALDVFRGATVCFMIVVNTPGSWSTTFSPLLHAPWHGFTPTDLVFPSFLFAVGTSISFVKRKWPDKTSSEVLNKIFKRFIIIFLIGFLLYWFPFVKWSEAGTLVLKPLSETRIMGVLQRIALCYFFAALMIYYLSQRLLIVSSAILLLAYWGMLYFLGDYSLEGNFARTLDRWLLGDNHLYKGEGIPFDPEGLLSTLPAIVNVIAGYFTGAFIIKNKVSFETLAKLLLASVGLIVLAYCWDLLFPINKKLWTSSYVILTIGIDLALLAAIFYSTDFIKKPFNYYFFEVFGKNPLFIYLLSGFLTILLFFFRIDGKQSLYNYIYVHGFSWINPYLGSFLFALTFMLICWSVGWWMDKKKIYIRV